MIRALLVSVVIFHMWVVVMNVIAFFLLPFTCFFLDIPFWFSLFLVCPIESIIVTLSFAHGPCPLTRLENRLRKQLGMKEIGGFIGYYFVKRKWRKDYRSRVKGLDPILNPRKEFYHEREKDEQSCALESEEGARDGLHLLREGL